MKQDIILISSQIECLANVCSILKHFGMNVFQAECIESVDAGLASHSPAFLLLDGDMEGAKSFLTAVASRVLHPPPYVIVAGTFLHSKDYIAMLNFGADACIRKPINAEKILSIVRSVYRRESRLARLSRGRLLPRIEYKELLIDPLRKTVAMRGEQITLTVKEFDVLYFLAYHAGAVLTRKEIFESVWNETYCEDSTAVSDHISSLRQKLKLDKKDIDYIQTVFGVGYRFANINQNK